MLNIFKNGKNSHQINLYCRWLEEILIRGGIPIKHNAKNPSFSPDEELEMQVSLEEMFHEQIIRTRLIDGGTRLILNLKDLNDFVKYEHFKMDSIKTIIKMVTRNYFMPTLDLNDAYYGVAISRLFQKFFKFKWKDKLYFLHVFQMVFGLAQKDSLN